MKATDEQVAIIESARDGNSTLVQAYAGCAKTTTLVAAAKALSDAKPKQSKLAVAFNVKIKDELVQKLSGYKDWEVRTLNSLGYGTLMANKHLWNNGQLTVDDKKSKYIVDDVLNQSSVQQWIEGQRLQMDMGSVLVDLMDKAKMFGYKPEQVTPEVIATLSDVESGPGELSAAKENIENMGSRQTDAVLNGLAKLVRGCLDISIGRARNEGLIDFNDQVYLAMLYCPHHGRSWDVIYVDEAQDLSRLNHMQVLKACRRQMLVFGDKFQALYGFRGATSESMEDLFNGWKEKTKQEMTRLQLSITFRCPQTVVSRQTRTVGITDFKARPEAGLGTVFLPFIGSGVDASWDFNDIADKCEARSKPFTAAVLSATNAPLYVAMGLIWQDLKCKVPDDFRDWCRFMLEVPPRGLLRVATSQPVFSHPTYRKQPALCALHYLYLVTGLNDDGLAELFAPNEHVTDQPIILSTVHRAKGLEWDHVYLFEKENIGEKGNLRYVAETRTKAFLGSIDIEDHWRCRETADPLQKYIKARKGATVTSYDPKIRLKEIATDIIRAHPSTVFQGQTFNKVERLIGKVESKLQGDEAYAFDPTQFLHTEMNRNEIHGSRPR